MLVQILDAYENWVLFEDGHGQVGNMIAHVYGRPITPPRRGDETMRPCLCVSEAAWRKPPVFDVCSVRKSEP
jgi:hypothetical protein